MNRKMRIGCLGPHTNSALAAEKAANIGDQVVFFDSMLDVLLALAKNLTDRIVVPVRNSITGEISYKGVAERMGLRRTEESREIIIPINHCIASRGADVGFVLSHREALAQCTGYLNERFPTAYRGEMASTGEAARFIAEVSSNNGAAIAGLPTCLHYRLRVIDTEIAKNNYSTFWVFQR